MWQGICFLVFEFPRSTVHHGQSLIEIRFQTAGDDRNCVEASKGSAMSKRLFIWIGLIILVGVIAAAGWSAYITFKRPATEAPPPPVRGKIPQIRQSTSAKTIHRAKIPPPTSPQQATMTAAKEETAAADARTTPAFQGRKVDPAPTNQPTEPTPMAIQEQPTPEPVEQTAVESPADQGNAQDPEDSAPSEPPPAQSDIPAAPAVEPEPENLAVQSERPEPKAAIQPPPPVQAAAPSTANPEPPEPAARQASNPKPPADSQFTIQVGAYRNKRYAEDAMALLSRKGYETYIFENTDKKSNTWHMVRFGHFPTRQAAQWALRAYQDKEQKQAIIARSGVR